MILELKRDITGKGAACKYLAEEDLGEGADVKGLTVEAALKIKKVG